MQTLHLRLPLFLLALGAALAAHAQNIVRDGDFEAAAVGTYSDAPFDDAWTVGGTLGVLSGNIGGSGSRYLLLGSGSVRQSLATATGTLYRVSMDMEGYNNGGTLTIGFGGQTLTGSYNPRAGDAPRKSFSFLATATSASTALSVSTSPSFGVDNVSVQAVPEPATLAILGLPALALVRRRAAASGRFGTTAKTIPA